MGCLVLAGEGPAPGFAGIGADADGWRCGRELSAPVRAFGANLSTGASVIASSAPASTSQRSEKSASDFESSGI
jgi:hypothetical protein